MPTPPSPVPALPAFPAVSNRTTYNQEAYDCLNALAATVAPAIGAAAANVHANAVDAEAAASTATAQANAAVAAVGAAVWVSGANYAVGAGVYSPSTLATYRCAVAGVSIADPAADPARWVRLGAAGVPDFVLQTLGVI